MERVSILGVLNNEHLTILDRFQYWEAGRRLRFKKRFPVAAIVGIGPEPRGVSYRMAAHISLRPISKFVDVTLSAAGDPHPTRKVFHVEHSCCQLSADNGSVSYRRRAHISPRAMSKFLDTMPHPILAYDWQGKFTIS
jgi:hypothetical protein